MASEPLGSTSRNSFLGPQVDGAQPLALAPQPLEIGLDLDDVGQRLVAPDLGEAGDLGRLDLEHLVDLVGDVREPARSPPSKRSSARAASSRAAPMAQRRACRPVGLGERMLAAHEDVGGVAAAGLRGGDLVDQRPALLLEQSRGVLEARARRPRFRDACASSVSICAAAPLRSLQAA